MYYASDYGNGRIIIMNQTFDPVSSGSLNNIQGILVDGDFVYATTYSDNFLYKMHLNLSIVKTATYHGALFNIYLNPFNGLYYTNSYQTVLIYNKSLDLVDSYYLDPTNNTQRFYYCHYYNNTLYLDSIGKVMRVENKVLTHNYTGIIASLAQITNVLMVENFDYIIIGSEARVRVYFYHKNFTYAGLSFTVGCFQYSIQFDPWGRFLVVCSNPYTLKLFS